MDEYLIEVGKKIKKIRKVKKMTIDDLAKKINKSKSAVSKYENGEINIDLITLKEISDVFEIEITNLIPQNIIKAKEKSMDLDKVPKFFKYDSKIYSYYYDGRNSKIVKSLIEIRREEDEEHSVCMYMNISDYEFPYICENTYSGNIEHFDSITRINLINKYTDLEKPIISILSPFVDSEIRWGLWSGISIRPIMPAAIKMLFSTKILDENKELQKKLLLNREDMTYIKKFNMFSVF
ncbi:helix-turn-helix domain-containing protein [uncultured Peptoniphilus sp.]|uniref:helix-turn-helix domain-containing protein n=1 Tax=uncultured Peptoniphilus sp. TaxID=254354 RepID=UPI0026087D57|nr:helix-turn-helix transcriptional regulator [uncultured Peptoniphilus sp.]